MLVVNTNSISLFSHEEAINVSKEMSKTLEKMSKGYKISKAADNASGLAIADRLKLQKSSIMQSIDNANSAIATIQIADRAMKEQSNILDIIKSKLISAATDTTTDDGRKAIAADINKYLEEIDEIAKQTNYNGQRLLQKSSDSTDQANDLEFQIGERVGDVIKITDRIQANTEGLAKDGTSEGSDYTLKKLKNDTDGDGSGLTIELAKKYLETIDTALTDLNSMRGTFGSAQTQIESSLRNMQTAHTNISNAESTIRDLDYASESSKFSKENILYQGVSYVLTQANASTSRVLTLLQ